MSTPHPEELTALLALNPAAREALARCEGPGWACKPGREPLIMATWGMSLPKPEEWAWLPASEAAILGVARELAEDDGGVLTFDSSGWEADHNVRGQSPSVSGGVCPTARLAALRLLAAVS